MLKWLREPQGERPPCEWDDTTVFNAAMSGNLEILKYLLDNGCEFTLKVAKIAKYKTHRHILEYLKTTGHITPDDYSEILKYAARGDDREFIQELLSQVSPIPLHVWRSLARAGHLDILKENRAHVMDRRHFLDSSFIRRRNALFINVQHRPTHLVGQSAARGGQLEVFKWVAEIDDRMPVGRPVLYAAIRSGNMQMIEWCFARCPEMDSDMTTPAIWKKNWKLLNWFVEQNCPLDCQVSDREVLEYISRHGGQLTSESAEITAADGILSTLKWLVEEEGCALNESCFYGAVTSGNLRMVKWLYEKKCPVPHKIVNTAMTLGHRHILEWLHKKGFALVEQDPKSSSDPVLFFC